MKLECLNTPGIPTKPMKQNGIVIVACGSDVMLVSWSRMENNKMLTSSFLINRTMTRQ